MDRGGSRVRCWLEERLLGLRLPEDVGLRGTLGNWVVGAEAVEEIQTESSRNR